MSLYWQQLLTGRVEGVIKIVDCQRVNVWTAKKARAVLLWVGLRPAKETVALSLDSHSAGYGKARASGGRINYYCVGYVRLEQLFSSEENLHKS